ncbi:MAG: PKD domain-containing protein [Thermoplasmata archaeon]|nr:MAG: PKD domain-containing protein [Thermoplasmata archaeon]
MNEKSRNKIVSGILTVMMIFGGLAVLLPISSDIAMGYSMPAGADWDMEDLVNNSGGAVTGGSGTYYVHEDIEISYNSSLTVNPGENVYFNMATGFKVYGYLSADGTDRNIINFTSNATTPNPGDWDGISFLSGTGLIDYARISYAEYGIYIYDTYLYYIANSEITKNDFGVFILDGRGYLYKNYIGNSTWDGIYCIGDGNPGHNYTTTINENTIVSSGYAGLFCDYSRVDIYDTYIGHNQYGIRSNMSEIWIQDSRMVSNTLYDFYLEWDTYVTSLNTTFDHNSVFFHGDKTLPPILKVQWFLHILVVDATGPVPGADVTVRDNENGTWNQHFMTGSNGRANWLTVTEYIEDLSIRTYYTPHNITAEKDNKIGYAEPFMDESKFVTVFIGPGEPPTNQPPVADAGPDQMVEEGETVYFDGSGSYDPDGYIVNYTWYFGDGNFGYGEYPTHVYHIPGTYNVTLTVKDDEGATDTDICIITVMEVTPPNQPPIADAGSDQTVFEDDVVNFDGSGSYDPDGFIVNYTWDFGDGNFGYGEFPTHIYDTPGSYNVTLTVTDDDNATDSDVMTVTVELRLPSPPRDLDAFLVQGSLEDVKLIWTASLDDGEGDNNVAGYTVYKSSNGIYGNYDFAAWIPAQGIPSHTYEWTDFDAGDGDINSYFYVVRANDTSNDEEQNNDRVGKFASYLEEGWNLISVPFIQNDITMEVVLQTLEGNYWAVQGYHAGKSRPWLNWHRDKPNYFNDVIEVNHEDGYYVYMLAADYLVTAGKVASQEQITLKSGWNLVGYPILTEKTRDVALSSISGNYNMVERFDTTLDKEVRLKSGDLMEPGLAYWIHATNDCTWTIMN